MRVNIMQSVKKSISITFFFTAVVLFLLPMKHSHADDLDNRKKALDIIREFADNVCFKIPVVGKKSNFQLSGEAKAELDGILKRLSDLGLKISGEYKNDAYFGVLQNDLANSIKESNDCKLSVISMILDKFLPPTPSNDRVPSSKPERPSPTPTRSGIVIGAPYPETGNHNDLGAPVRDGIEQAIADWNRKERNGLLQDGRKLVVDWKDDRCDGSKAREAANELLDLTNPAQVVIGHNCSGAALAAAPIYNDHDLLMISPAATNPDLTEEGYDFVFRMVGRDDDQADAAASFIAGNPKFRNVAILHDNEPYGLKLAELMQNSLRIRNITEVMFMKLDPPDDNDSTYTIYDSLIKDLNEKHVDVIYYAGYARIGVPLRKKTWSRGIEIPIVSGDGFAVNDYSTMVGEVAAAHTYITNTPRGNLAALNVARRLKANGKPVLPQTLHAYAAVDVWAQAVKLAGKIEGAAVANRLRGTKFKTVIGEISFDKNGDRSDFEPFFVWYTWRNGTYTELDPTDGKRLGLVCRTQAGLGALNYDVRWTDGLQGKFTRSSIKEFFKAKRKPHLRTIDEAMVKEIETAVAQAREWEESEALIRKINKWQYLGRVCRAQAGLKALDHYSGSLTGKEDSNFCTAVRNFKSEKGLRDAGCAINEALVKSIEDEVGRVSKEAIALP
jgi:branched-chain amino acid transport system substrate-binding protein